MTPDELKNKFDSLADTFMVLSKQLEDLESNLSLNMDKKALSEIISELHWAAENSTVIGLHQIGEALDDNMGTGHCD
jgi:hypothetical protein